MERAVLASGCPCTGLQTVHHSAGRLHTQVSAPGAGAPRAVQSVYCAAPGALSASRARAQDARDGAAERPYPLAPPAVVFDHPALSFPALAAVSAAAARRAAQLAGPEPFLHALLLWVAEHAAAAVAAAGARLAALEAAAAAGAPAQPERAADAPAPPAAAAGPGAGPGPRARAGAAGGAPARRPSRGAAGDGGRAGAGPVGAGGGAAEAGGDSGEDAEEVAARQRMQLLQRLMAQDDAVRGLASRRARHTHAHQTFAQAARPSKGQPARPSLTPASERVWHLPARRRSGCAVMQHHTIASRRC